MNTGLSPELGESWSWSSTSCVAGETPGASLPLAAVGALAGSPREDLPPDSQPAPFGTQILPPAELKSLPLHYHFLIFSSLGCYTEQTCFQGSRRDSEVNKPDWYP